MKKLPRVSLIVCLGIIFVILFACNKSDVPVELLDPQIVGGREAKPHQLKFIVHIGYNSEEAWCGGSIINKEWVLTAAHCVRGERPKNLIVVAGDHSLSRKNEGEQVRRVVKIVKHHDYNRRSFDNDIALVKVNRPFVFNRKVRPIAVGDLADANKLRVAGWGDVVEGGTSSDVLLFVNVPLQSESQCSAAYPGRITNNMVCAGPRRGGKDACKGDSGSPMFRRVERKWQQVGIVSWGEGCAQSGAYGVYTKLENYRSWINSTIR